MRIKLLPLAALMTWAAPAWASGGAHVVDDAEVMTPGVCQLESWATRASGTTLITAAPACTLARLPWMDLGGFAEYSTSGGEEDMMVGPAVKFALVPAERGLGVGLVASAGFSLADGRIGSASLLVPLTTDLSDRLRLNVNAGWTWSRAPFAHEALWGAQLEYAATSDLALMAETFGTSRAGAGWQSGLRWNPGGGAADLDLLYRDDGRGREGRAFTIGLTLRR